MPVCPKCGQFNDQNNSQCQSCGIALGHQVRAKADVRSHQANSILKIGIWIAIIAVVALVGPGVYHSGKGAYLKFHLDSVTANAVQSCGGPMSDTAAQYQRDQYDKCMNEYPDLAKAKQDMADFKK